MTQVSNSVDHIALPCGNLASNPPQFFSSHDDTLLRVEFNVLNWLFHAVKKGWEFMIDILAVLMIEEEEEEVEMHRPSLFVSIVRIIYQKL